MALPIENSPDHLNQSIEDYKGSEADDDALCVKPLEMALEEREDYEDLENEEDEDYEEDDEEEETGEEDEEKKEKKKNKPNLLKSAAEGAVVGSVKNAVQYAVKVGGRKSNVVSVFDKTARSARGNPKWFARVDMPHGKVNYPHINVNKAITGVKDPHVPISAGAAKTAGAVGGVLNVVNKAAPVLLAASVAYDAVQIGKEVVKDRENHSSRNTVKKAVTTAATYAGGIGLAGTGAAIGTVIFPGIGTLIGGLIGGIFGGTAAGVGSEIAAEAVLEAVHYDLDWPKCEKCGEHFENRRYEEGPQKRCRGCRN